MISLDDKLNFILHKSLKMELAPGLDHSEFKCQCNSTTCHITLMSPRLKDAWTVVRLAFGKKLTINSGFRCQQHNKDVGGIANSRHTMGQAIDISTKNLEPLEVAYLKELLERNFDKVLEYPTFYHAHVE